MERDRLSEREFSIGQIYLIESIKYKMIEINLHSHAYKTLIKRRNFHSKLSHFSFFFFFFVVRIPTRLSNTTQRVKFQTHEDSFAYKIEMDTIATASTRPLYAKQNQAYSVELLVPPAPPTDETSSAICKVHYFLTVMHS